HAFAPGDDFLEKIHAPLCAGERIQSPAQHHRTSDFRLLWPMTRNRLRHPTLREGLVCRALLKQSSGKDQNIHYLARLSNCVVDSDLKQRHTMGEGDMKR